VKKEITTSVENSFNESTNSVEKDDWFKIKIEVDKILQTIIFTKNVKNEGKRYHCAA